MNKLHKYQPECVRLLELGNKLKWGLYIFLRTNKSNIALIRNKSLNHKSNLSEVVRNLFLIPKFVLNVRDTISAIVREDRAYGLSLSASRLMAIVHDLDIIKDAHTSNISSLIKRYISAVDSAAQSFVPGLRPQHITPKRATAFLGTTTSRLEGKEPESPSLTASNGTGAAAAASTNKSTKTRPVETNNNSNNTSNNFNSSDGSEADEKVAGNPSVQELQSLLNWYVQKNSGVHTIRSS